MECRVNNVLDLEKFRKIKQLKVSIERLGYSAIVAEYEKTPQDVKEIKKDIIRLETQLKLLNLSKEA